MKKALLIFNEKAGQKNDGLLEQITSLLGDNVTVIHLEDISDMKEIPLRAREAGVDYVAVAGGDGTIGAVASALVGTDIPLGVIPVGTFNNFAKSLHVPLDPEAACGVILNGAARPVDVGMVNGKPFFEALGAGMDAALFPMGEEIKGGGIMKWLSLFHLALRYPRHHFRLTLDRPVIDAFSHSTSRESRRFARKYLRHKGVELLIPAFMVIVSNGPYFGMNFALAPQERMDDGLFTISILTRFNKFRLWWHFFSIAQGHRQYSPMMLALRVSSLKLTARHKLPVHLDGTPTDLWPLEISCNRGALHVFRNSPAT